MAIFVWNKRNRRETFEKKKKKEKQLRIKEKENWNGLKDRRVHHDFRYDKYERA